MWMPRASCHWSAGNGAAAQQNGLHHSGWERLSLDAFKKVFPVSTVSGIRVGCVCPERNLSGCWGLPVSESYGVSVNIIYFIIKQHRNMQKLLSCKIASAPQSKEHALGNPTACMHGRTHTHIATTSSLLDFWSGKSNWPLSLLLAVPAVPPNCGMITATLTRTSEVCL